MPIMPTYTAYGQPNRGWWSRPRQRTCFIAITSSGLTQDHGGKDAKMGVYLDTCTEKITLSYSRTALKSRIKPLPNWPDSNKIKELYAGDTSQGDEMILGSAMLQQV